MKHKLLYTCLIVLFVFIGTRRVSAQQDPHYSHYMFNSYVFNPALAGSKESLSMVGLFRTQFVGIEGGPKTQSISAHMPVAPLHGGAGLHIVNDQVGYERMLTFLASYAYRYQMANGILAAGASLGFMQRTLQGDKLIAAQPDAAVPNTTVNAIKPDINLGVLYSTEQYYVGLSASHLNQANLNYELPVNNSNYKNVLHYYLTAGYNWNLNPTIDIKPSVILKQSKSLQAEANVMLFYNQKIWGGLSYRLDDALIGIVGFNVTDRIKLSYAYDYTLSKLSVSSKGSHEVLLGYDVTFAKKIKTDVIIKTPRFL